jgi:ABC-type transport system involved in cytochrome bd biosynthesis fused ATPase/permease subunit
MFGYLAIIPMIVFIFIWTDMMVKGKFFFNLIFALIFMLGVIGAGFAEAFFKINFATTLFVIVYLIMFIQIYIYMKYRQRNNEEEELKYNDNKESKIDIFEFFADVDREEIEEWIEKVEKLIKHAPDFENLSMCIMNAYRDADGERAKEYEEEMHVICKNFIRVNPGFSDNTYEKNIRI